MLSRHSFDSHPPTGMVLNAAKHAGITGGLTQEAGAGEMGFCLGQGRNSALTKSRRLNLVLRKYNQID